MRSLRFIITSVVGVSVVTVSVLILLLACGVRGRMVALVLAGAMFLITLAVLWLLGMGTFPWWIVPVAVVAAGGGYLEMRRTWRLMQPLVRYYYLEW
jgi:hypothetical protein